MQCLESKDFISPERCTHAILLGNLLVPDCLIEV